MKKIWPIIAGVIVVAATIVAFVIIPQSSNNPDEGSNQQNIEASNSHQETNKLSDPIVQWWELYNPNGFDTLTGIISNPNSTAIDVTFDLVYYKDGQEIARSEGLFNNNILPNHEAIIWSNYDIPKSVEVDDIKMENITTTESVTTSINGKYEYVDTTDGGIYFDFEFDDKPTLATIWLLLYNDKNQNEKYDKGEIISADVASLMEQKGRVNFDTEVGYPLNYQVFFTAYK